jgi:hypothetical protein
MAGRERVWFRHWAAYYGSLSFPLARRAEYSLQEDRAINNRLCFIDLIETLAGRW